jgi:hypothetical protein
MPGQNNGETLAQSQSSRLEVAGFELVGVTLDRGSSLPNMGAAVRIRRHATGNQFLFMASVTTREFSLRPSFLIDRCVRSRSLL